MSCGVRRRSEEESKVCSHPVGMEEFSHSLSRKRVFLIRQAETKRGLRKEMGGDTEEKSRGSLKEKVKLETLLGWDKAESGGGGVCSIK